MNNFLDILVQVLTDYGPAFVSVLASVAAIVSGIKAIAKSNEENKQNNAVIREQLKTTNARLNSICKENAELKRENAEIKANINKIYRGE